MHTHTNTHTHACARIHTYKQYRGVEFKPLRLLKTIINQLVNLRGQEIRDHLTLIPVHTNPTLCSYLDLVFKHQLQSLHQGHSAHESIAHQQGTGGAGSKEASACAQMQPAHVRTAEVKGAGTATRRGSASGGGGGSSIAATELLITKFQALKSQVEQEALKSPCTHLLSPRLGRERRDQSADKHQARRLRSVTSERHEIASDDATVHTQPPDAIPHTHTPPSLHSRAHMIASDILHDLRRSAPSPRHHPTAGVVHNGASEAIEATAGAIAHSTSSKQERKENEETKTEHGDKSHANNSSLLSLQVSSTPRGFCCDTLVCLVCALGK